MSVAPNVSRGAATLTWRFALREMRGGLRGFAVFIACIALGVAVDPALLARLGIECGARVTIGAATIELRAILKTEPDKLAGGIGFGPRLMISEPALRATGLVQPGSLIRWHYRLRLLAADANDRMANAVVAASERQLP